MKVQITGLIEGAATGAGLGVRFLKHLTRTSVLLHIVDCSPLDGSSPIDAIQRIENELSEFSQALLKRKRWLVLNKIDLLTEDALQTLQDKLTAAGYDNADTFLVSAVTGTGLDALKYAVMDALETQWQQCKDDDDFASSLRQEQALVQEQARASIQRTRAIKRGDVSDANEASNGEIDTDNDVDVEYRQ